MVGSGDPPQPRRLALPASAAGSIAALKHEGDDCGEEHHNLVF
jgi:hypothetical protein